MTFAGGLEGHAGDRFLVEGWGLFVVVILWPCGVWGRFTEFRGFLGLDSCG